MIKVKTSWADLGSRIRRSFPDELRFQLRFPKLIIDYNCDYRKAVFLAGVGRSGTTWVSNIMNYDNRYRDMFEPFHSHYVYESRRFIYPLYVRPEEKLGNHLRQARRILTGQIRHPWIDHNNRRFVVDRRLIKEIRANLWLKWLKTNFPELPIILLFRHPCAVAESRLALEWPTRLGQYLAQEQLMSDHLESFRDLMMAAQTPFERHIIAWCLQYYVPLRQFQPEEIHVAYYENFIAKPEQEVANLFGYLKQPYDSRVFDSMAKRSATTYLRGAARADMRTNLADSWRKHFDLKEIRRAVELLARFGLGTIYGDAPLPCDRGAIEIMRRNREITHANWTH
jgi:hypothetical protein